MNTSWPLQEAKNKLSQVVQQAASEGPQVITVRGRPAAVVVSTQEYERLTRPSTSLLDFFQQSPLYGLELDIERSKDVGRDGSICSVDPE
jgi:prevent-host-death family protein